MAQICTICESTSSHFFQKKYDSYRGSPFLGVWEVHYFKCNSCGFVFSQTHRELNKEKWENLNSSWHHAFESGLFGTNINQPPYANMALATKMLSVNGLLNMNASLDYAAGYGTFAKILQKYFNEIIYKYDPYVTGEKDDYYIEYADLSKYDFLVNTAMFEHILTRNDIDSVNNLVSGNGVMMLHTQIREEIPKDPSWFYLEPHVHSAFFTNKSMQILMEQWGYGCSIYSPEARVWFLFKNSHPALEEVESTSSAINKELQREYFYYKKGFMDYWK